MNPLGAIKLYLGPEEPEVEPYTLILSYIPHDKQGQILSVHNLSVELKLNAPDEISFTSYKYLDKENTIVDPLWDEIEDLKLVYVKELNEYFSIEVTKSDERSTVKQVVGTDASAVELSQVIMNHNEFNTDEDIAREDYEEPTIFYNDSNHKASLLHRALEEAPQWSIGYVDNSLQNIQRTFSADNISIYDFLTGDVADEVHCLFLFDTVNKRISAYDLDTVCPSCGHRGKYYLMCPECGSVNLRYFGNDTQIYFDIENLASSVHYETDVDSIKNCFRVEGGDDLMTATIANLNPNGTNYIYYFSQECLDAMPHLLKQKMESYTALMASYEKQFTQLCEDIYESIKRLNELQHSMMPSVTKQTTDAKTEVRKLTSATLSPCAVYSDPTRVSSSSAENSIRNYARAVVNSARFKIEVKTTSWNAPTWRGTITLTSYSDKEDTATSGAISVTLTNNYREYIEQRIEIEGRQLSDKDEYGNIFDILSINNLASLKKELKLYSLERLKAFYDAYQEILDIMIQTDQARPGMELYESHYLTYLEKQKAVEAEIAQRDADIAAEQANYDNLFAQRSRIQQACNFEKYLGTDLYKTFCAFRREDLYKNNNFKSKGLNDKELVDKAKELWGCANDEIVKAGEYQHKITGALIDFLAIPAFRDFFTKEPIALGDWVNVGIDDDVYRLRLIEVGLDFDSLQNIDVTFSDVEKIRDGFSDTRSILAQAKRMGTSFGALKNQVDGNTDAQGYVNDWVGRGLDLTLLTVLSDVDHQEMKMDDQGLWLRQYDPFTDRYEPEQTRIINNGIYYTSDAWQSLRACLGKFVFPDPRNGYQNTECYGVLAEYVVGRVVLSEDVGIWTEHGSIKMDKDGYHQYVKENPKANDDQTFFLIEYEPDGKQAFDVLRIDRTGFYVNMPEGKINFESAIFNVDSSEISMNGAEVNMAGGNMHLSAESNLKIDSGSDLELEGANLRMNAGNMDINTTGDFTLDSQSKITLKGTEIDISGTKIDLTGLFCANGAITVTEEGHVYADSIGAAYLDCDNFVSHTSMTVGMMTGHYTMTFTTDDGVLWVGPRDTMAFHENGAFWLEASSNKCTITGALDVGKKVLANEKFVVHCSADLGYDGPYKMTFNATNGTIWVGQASGTDGAFYLNGQGTSTISYQLDVGKKGGMLYAWSGADITGGLTVDGTAVVGCSCSSGGEGAGDQGMEGPSMISNAAVNRNAAISLSPSAGFCDYGTAQIAEDGLAFVEVDPLLLSLGKGKIVPFVQAYGKSEVYIDEVNSNYFVVKGAPHTTFGWQVHLAKNDEQERLSLSQSSLDQIRNEVIQADDSISNVENYVFELLNSESETIEEGEVVPELQEAEKKSLSYNKFYGESK